MLVETRPNRMRAALHPADAPPADAVRAGLPPLLGQLLAFGRVLRLYPCGHERVKKQREQLATVLREVRAALREPIELVQRDGRMLAGGQTLAESSTLTSSFARTLQMRGIRGLVLEPGLRMAEAETLARLLSLPLKELLERGGAAGYAATHGLTEVTILTDGEPGSECGNAQGDGATEEDAAPSTETEAGDPDTESDTETDTETDGGPAGAQENPDAGAFSATVPAGLRRQAESALKSQVLAHDPGATAAAAVCRLLSSARDPEEYRIRRTILLGTLRQGWFSGQNMRGALCGLVGELPDSIYEDPTGLILELGARAGEESVLEAGQRVMHLHPNAVREFLDAIGQRRDVFDILFFLARAELPSYVRTQVFDTIGRIAHHRRTAFEQWALAHRGAFLHRGTFSELIQRDPLLVGPVVKEILIDRRGRERDAMLALLVSLGGSKALRLLILGLRHEQEPRDPKLIAAIGEFAHPLAVAVLREVVHRCNAGRYGEAEAEAALIALRDSRLDVAHTFLWEIRTKHILGLPLYRRQLRKLAERIVEHKVEATE